MTLKKKRETTRIIWKCEELITYRKTGSIIICVQNIKRFFFLLKGSLHL